MGSKAKGARYEQRLVRFLDEAGYAVMKSPSSGSGTTRDQPDVYAVAPGDAVSLEVKYDGSTDGIIYLTGDEIDALVRFATMSVSQAVVATRWARDTTFYLFRPDDLEETPEGNLRVTRDDCERAVRMLADTPDEWDDVDNVDDDPRATPADVSKYGVVR